MNKYLVYNCTRHLQIASKVERADRIGSRMKGLIGRSSEEFLDGDGLWIVPCQGIHTIGMSFAIDAAYLDRDNRVIRIYDSLPPFRMAALKFGAKSVLELPAGSLARSGTVLGDVLEFKAADLRRTPTN
jgi:uncharacterized protein